MHSDLCYAWTGGLAKHATLTPAPRWVVPILLLLAPLSLIGHPISLVTTEALVHRDRLEIKISVMPEDFLLVYGLSADERSRIARHDILDSAQKHRAFLLNGLIIRDEDGSRLEGKVLKVDVPALPADGLPMTDLMATTIEYHLEYPLSKPPTH